MLKILDKILDTFSDKYHCKKCDAKLGCAYCKTYGGHIANNKYNSDEAIKKARRKYIEQQTYEIYLELKNKYENINIEKLKDSGEKIKNGEVIPFEQPKLCENDVFETLKERVEQIKRDKGIYD